MYTVINNFLCVKKFQQIKSHSIKNYSKKFSVKISREEKSEKSSV